MKIPVETIISARDSASAVLRGVGRSAGDASSQMDALKGAALAAASAMSLGAVKSSLIDPAAEMQSAMKGLAKVSDDLDPAQLAQMRVEARDMAIELGRSATGIIDIMAAGKRSNFEGDLTRLSRMAAMMATAWDGVDDGGAATFLTSFQKGMNLTEEQTYGLADAVNALGNAFNMRDESQLAGTLVRMGAIARTAGLAAVETAALNASILNAGASEEIAATGSKNLLNALTKGTAATKAQREAFKAMGLDAGVVAKKMQKDAPAAILEVLDALAALDAVDQPAVLSRLVGEGKGAIAPLLANIGELRRAFNLVADDANYLDAVRQEFEKFSDGNILVLEDSKAAAWKGLATTLGKELLPTYERLLTLSRDFAISLTAFVEQNPNIANNITQLAIAAGTLGPALISVRLLTRALGVGGLLGALGGVIRVAGTLGAAVGLGGVAAGALAATKAVAALAVAAAVAMGPVVLAFAAGAAAAHLIYKNWDGIAEWFRGTLGEIKAAFEVNFVSGIGTMLRSFSPGEYLANGFENLGDMIAPMMGPTGKKVVDALTFSLSTAARYLDPISFIGRFLESIGSEVARADFAAEARKMWDTILSVEIPSPREALERFFKEIQDIFSGFDLSDAVSQMWDTLRGVEPPAITAPAFSGDFRANAPRLPGQPAFAPPASRGLFADEPPRQRIADDDNLALLRALGSSPLRGGVGNPAPAGRVDIDVTIKRDGDDDVTARPRGAAVGNVTTRRAVNTGSVIGDFTQ